MTIHFSSYTFYSHSIPKYGWIRERNVSKFRVQRIIQQTLIAHHLEMYFVSIFTFFNITLQILLISPLTAILPFLLAWYIFFPSISLYFELCVSVKNKELKYINRVFVLVRFQAKNNNNRNRGILTLGNLRHNFKRHHVDS